MADAYSPVIVEPPSRLTSIGLNKVRFDGSTTFESPFFWIAIGAILGFWAAHYMSRKGREF